MTIAVKETTVVLAANTPALIASGVPGCSLFIMSNNGAGGLTWKCKSAPASALDGTPLGIPDSSGQGGSVVLTGADAIGDDIYGWSVAGTTVNVKQGTTKP